MYIHLYVYDENDKTLISRSYNRCFEYVNKIAYRYNRLSNLHVMIVYSFSAYSVTKKHYYPQPKGINYEKP